MRFFGGSGTGSVFQFGGGNVYLYLNFYIRFSAQQHSRFGMSLQNPVQFVLGINSRTGSPFGRGGDGGSTCVSGA